MTAPSVALRPEVHGRRADAGERAAQVDLDDGVEVVVGHLPQHPVAQHAGVGDHHVEPAELLDRPVDEPLGGLRGADRHDLGDGAAARGRDLVDDRGGGLVVHVVDDDGGAGVGQRRGVGAAEALPAAGDDGDLSGDVHVLWLLVVGWCVGQPKVRTGLMVAPLLTSSTACWMSAKS